MPPIRRPSNYVARHAKRSVGRLKQDLGTLREQIRDTKGQMQAIRGEYFGSMRMAIEDQLDLKELGTRLARLEQQESSLAAQLKERGGKDPVERVGFTVLPGVDANIPGVVGVRVQAGVQRAIDRETGKAHWHLVGSAALETHHGEVGLTGGGEGKGLVAMGSPMPFLETGYNALAEGVVTAVHVPGVGVLGASHTGHLEATVETPFFGPGLTVAIDHPKVRDAAKVAGERVRGALDKVKGERPAERLAAGPGSDAFEE